MFKYIICSFIAGIIGFLVGMGYHSSSHSFTPKIENHEHTDNMHMSSEVHHHEKITLAEGSKIPAIDLIVHNDPKSGWNLQVITENFILAPERASTDHQDGEGHMHLFIDDKKLTRLYSEWYHIPADTLSSGTHKISVNLSANNHADYVYQGSVIGDTETITVKK